MEIKKRKVDKRILLVVFQCEGDTMNLQGLNQEQRAREDLDWLAQKGTVVGQKEESYFCQIIRDALARGWDILDARYYALGRVMGTHNW